MTANKIFLWFLCHSSRCYRLQAESSRVASMHHPEYTNNGNKGRCLFGKQEKLGRLPSPWHHPREDLQRLAAMCHQMIACTADSCQHSCRHHTDGCFGCCTCGTVSVHWSIKFTECTVVWSACVDALLYLLYTLYSEDNCLYTPGTDHHHHNIPLDAETWFEGCALGLHPTRNA